MLESQQITIARLDALGKEVQDVRKEVQDLKSQTKQGFDEVDQRLTRMNATFGKLEQDTKEGLNRLEESLTYVAGDVYLMKQRAGGR